MPRVSATMRSRTFGSIPPNITDSSSSRESASDRPSISSAGRPAKPSGESRTANTNATGSASSRLRDEPERLHRHLVEPLRVVDETEQRLVIGGGGHQAQHRQPDQETVRGLPGAAAESDVQRLALRFRQLIEVVHQRCAQLLQPGECELHVGFHAGHLHDAESRRQL